MKSSQSQDDDQVRKLSPKNSAAPPSAATSVATQECAMGYIERVRATFKHSRPHIFKAFLDIMEEFKSQAIGVDQVKMRVLQLFATETADHPQLCTVRQFRNGNVRIFLICCCIIGPL